MRCSERWLIERICSKLSTNESIEFLINQFMAKLLITGGIPDEKHRLRYGGATVLLADFISFLRENDIEYDFVQTNKYSNLNSGDRRQMLNHLYFLFQFLRKIWYCDRVLFNFSDHGVVYLYPYLSSFARLLGKKIVLRKFGGSLDIYLKTVSEKKKGRMVKALKCSDLLFIETKAGISHIQSLVGDDVPIQWCPNNRKSSIVRKDAFSFKKRCVCMSHIKTEKGIDDLLKVKKLLPEEYTIDLYGAIKEDKFKNFDFSKYGITFHGQISSNKVLRQLCQYDLLLLTSYREGQPGIIIEALSVGLPVVATNVGGIPELIKNGYNGFLVAQGDIEGFKDSIVFFSDKNYPQFSQNALESFEKNFNSDVINKMIIDKILTI